MSRYDHYDWDSVHRALEDREEDDHDDYVNKPWGQVIGASLLVQTATFSGLLLLGFVSCFQRLASGRMDKESIWYRLHNQIIPSFAAGALLATAVFLVIPEGITLLEGGGHGSEDEHMESEEVIGASNSTIEEEGHEEEEEAVPWRFGVCLLGGFLFPILMGAFFPPPPIVSDCGVCYEHTDTMKQDAVDVGGKGNGTDTTVKEINQDNEVDVDSDWDVDKEYVPSIKKNVELDEELSPSTKKIVESNDSALLSAQVVEHAPKNIALASSIIFGDFCHNFADGIFIGTAFLLCGKSLAWTITATTIYHEIAQEIADFALLTYQCGLSLPVALAANFLSGSSVLLGGIIVLAVSLSDKAIGAILCISAGVYFNIAATECIPRVMETRRESRDTFIFLLSFLVGAIPIGLVLLNHQHCEGHGDEEH